MNRAGPALPTLLQRIAETPPAFLATPYLASSVAALQSRGAKGPSRTKTAVVRREKTGRRGTAGAGAVVANTVETAAEAGGAASIPDIASVVHVAAVVNDLCQALVGEGPTPDQLQLFVGVNGDDLNHLSTTLLMCWVLTLPWFSGAGLTATMVLQLLDEGARSLAAETAARKFVADAERREELARFVLASLGFRPEGESIAQAQDRLTSLSAAERKRVMRAARAGEARARAIREALARKAAQESADKWTRE